MAQANPIQKIPILLLKTKSLPTDTYQEYFEGFEDGEEKRGYEPVFIPVLEHRFRQDALDELKECILNGGFSASRQHATSKRYGAIILTSQRAVEAFARIVEEIREARLADLDELLPGSLPLYVVGPATARGLRSLNLRCGVLGEETGNGDALGRFILEHYNGIYPGADKPSILFLVGEKRRDIIPKTLQSEELPSERRAVVEEVVIYETGEMASFGEDFRGVMRGYEERGVRKSWVVVFSPQGCKAMLQELGLLDERGRVSEERMKMGRRTWIASIGPTTRDYLKNEFGFDVDVCAEKPSPEGIGEGIKAFLERRKTTS